MKKSIQTTFKTKKQISFAIINFNYIFTWSWISVGIFDAVSMASMTINPNDLKIKSNALHSFGWFFNSQIASGNGYSFAEFDWFYLFIFLLLPIANWEGLTVQVLNRKQSMRKELKRMSKITIPKYEIISIYCKMKFLWIRMKLWHWILAYGFDENRILQNWSIWTQNCVSETTNELNACMNETF